MTTSPKQSNDTSYPWRNLLWVLVLCFAIALPGGYISTLLFPEYIRGNALLLYLVTVLLGALSYVSILRFGRVLTPFQVRVAGFLCGIFSSQVAAMVVYVVPLAFQCVQGVIIFESMGKLASLPAALLVCLILYRVLFSEQNRYHRIVLEGTAQAVDPVRQDSAFPFQFLGRMINLENVEVLNFRLETKFTNELHQFLPAGFKQPGESDDAIVVSVEMRGQLEGMIRPGDYIQFEAWSDGFTLFTDTVRNSSTYSTIKTQQPPRWLYYFVISGASLVTLLFLAQIITEVVSGMGMMRSPTC